MSGGVVNTPKLRFPEFSGEWEETTLGKVAGRPSYGMNAAAKPFDGKHKYLRITDIDEENRSFSPSPLTSPEPPISGEHRLRQGDIVFARTGASTGKSYLYNEKDGDLYFAGFLIRFPVTKANHCFTYLVTLRESFRNWVSVTSMRSGQPGVNAQEYSTFPFHVPKLPEQQKIAAFLGAVDAKIGQLTREKALLEDYKKGCMQQLFTQKLRFKDDNGNDFPDWEEKKLGDIAKFFSGGTPKSSNVNFYSGHIPFIGSGDISAMSVSQFITEEAISSSSAKLIERGDLLYALYGATSGAVAIAKISGAINQAVLCIRSDENTQFLLYWLTAEKEKIVRTYLQGGQGNLSAQIVKELKIALPHPDEQQKIADFLSAIDAKISLVADELRAAQDFKKGLLQQMFV